MSRKNGPLVLDCTIRDGGYVNNWNFDNRMVREVYRSLSKAGVDYIELGFRGNEKYFDRAKFGTWRFSTEEDLREVIQGINGIPICIMGDYGKIDLTDFDEKKDSVIDLVRIAVHKTNIFNAIKLLEKIKLKGYQVSLQAMAFRGYTQQEKNDLITALKHSDLDFIYIADSYGSFLPNQMEEIFAPFLELPNIKVGFHPHNNLQLAFANTLEAIKLGVNIIDASIYGMGRGAGNLPIEVLISYLGNQSKDKYNVIPILNCIDNFFIELKKKYPWGYNLPYMISGIFNLHPYYAKDLVDRREYSIEDIWKGLEVVEKIKPVGFDRSLIDTLIEKGIIGSLGERVRITGSKLAVEEDIPKSREVERPPSYLKRHPDADFLVLANGPSLKEYRDRIDAFIKKYNPIVLGANYLGGMFIPQYHAFNNKKRFINYIETVSFQSRLLIGQNISKEMIAEYTPREYERLLFKDILAGNFDIINGIIQSNCRTISVLLIGVAIVMGANRIFVAGMDGYVGLAKEGCSLFYEEKDEPEQHELMLERQYWNKRFLEQIADYLYARNKEEPHILTPTSFRTFYKGIENYL